MFHNEDLENAMEPVLQVINSGFFFQYFMKSLLLTIRLLELLFWCELFLKNIWKGFLNFHKEVLKLIPKFLNVSRKMVCMPQREPHDILETW